jgi:hypothetical protein
MEIARFFQGRDRVHQTLRRVVKKLAKANIPYAVAGGLAVFAHRHRRTTADIDLLLTPEGFAERLHPSVRMDYLECLEEKKREDDYEAREG